MSLDPPPKSPSTSLGTWLGLEQCERWDWWQERWREALELSDRYRLTLRSGWWEDSLRVEALAAFAAGVAAYDTNERDDAPGKLQLLATLDWLRGVLRGGEQAFDPRADRPAFDQHLLSIGCRPPDTHPIKNQPVDPTNQHQRRALTQQLETVKARLLELKQRRHTLRSQLEQDPASRGDHARRDLSQLEHTITELRRRQRNLRRQLRAARERAD